MFSVIVPTFNRKKFITAAIDSIVDQGYSDSEIIIVDDRSTDGTDKVVQELQNLHSNITYIRNNRAKGPSGARNEGMSVARCEFVAFLDSDDVWLPDYLSLAEKVFRENGDIDVLFSNFVTKDFETGEVISDFLSGKKVLLDMEGTSIDSGIVKIKGDLFSALIEDNFFNLCGAIFRKSVLDDLILSEKHRYSEDRDIAIRIAVEKKATFAYRVEPAFVAYRHGSNMCRGNNDILDDIRANADQMDQFISYYHRYTLSSIQKKCLLDAICRLNNNLLWGYKRTFNLIKYLKAQLFKIKFKSFAGAT